MELTTWLIRNNPDDQGAKNVKAEALRQWGYLQSVPGWRNWALTGALELENGPFPISDLMINLSADTMDEMGYDDLFKIIRVRFNPEGHQDREELVNLMIGKDKFTFGIRHGVVISDKNFSRGREKVVMSRQQFYDIFFFDKDLPKDANSTIRLVIQATGSPYGKLAPVVGR